MCAKSKRDERESENDPHLGQHLRSEKRRKRRRKYAGLTECEEGQAGPGEGAMAG